MEFPDLEQAIHRQYPSDQVRVIGLHPTREPAALVQDFREQTGVTFDIVPDQRNTLGQFVFPPGVDFPYPRDVVIGPDLTIHSIKNSFDADETQALVEQLLAE